MKKYIALTLAVLLTAALLTGCSKPDTALVGTWQGQLPLASIISEQEQSILNLPATLSFFEDGTFALTLDTSEIVAKLDEISQKAETAGQSAKGGIEQILKALGVENEMLTQVLKWLFPEKSGEDDSQQKSATVNGRFKTEDGKIFLSLVKVVGIYSDTYITYTVTDDALTLEALGGAGEEIGNIAGKLLPMTLQKTQ